MKLIILTILVCYALMAESQPFLGLDAVAGIGNGLASAVGTGVGTAACVGAGAIGLGAGVVNGVAKGLTDVLELGVGIANGLAQEATNVLGEGTGVAAV